MAYPHQADVSGGTDEGATPARHPGNPGNPHEETILGIWRDILGRTDIGVRDDFFDLDGNSLGAIQVIARIRELYGVSVRAMDFFESPTVETLAAAVAAAVPSERPVVGPRPHDAEPVLSYDQQRLWLENQLLPGAAYHVHGRQRLLGPLDVAALDGSLRAILQRHEALRSRFPTLHGRPVQLVDELDEDWHLRVETVSDPAAAAAVADDDALVPFDLERGPLVRCLLIKVSDTEYLLSITAHHIVCDDWSVGLFGRELSALYAAGGDLEKAGLADLAIQYRDFAVWQRRWLTGEALAKQVSYWRQHLAGAPSTLVLPSRRRRTPDEVPVGGRARATLSTVETAAVHELCHRTGATTFMVLLATLSTVLGRWSGQRDLVIGVPITGRTDAGTQTLIGFFVNTLPLRVDLTGDPTFAQVVERARQSAVGGYAHADAPLDLLVGELPAARVPGRTPLFQVILNVVGSPEVQPLQGITGEVLDAPARPSKFDLTLTAREWDGVLQLELEFNADRYEPAMIERLLAQVTALLRAATADPDRGILDYPLEQPPALADAPQPIVEQSAPDPDRVAVIGRDGEWTYRRLDAAADRVARALVERYPRNADHQLGIVRRAEAGTVAMILGCVRAGVTFSVLDAGATGVPGLSGVLDVSPVDGTPTVDLSDDGSTGAPAARRDWAVDRYDIHAGDRIAVLSGVPEHLLSALASAYAAGATLVLSDHLDPAWLRASGITVAYVTPPILRALAARAEPLPALRHVFVDNAGDLLSHDVAALRRLSATARCVGLYRVDRDGVPATAYEVPADWTYETAPLRIPLGTEIRAAAVLRHASGQAAATGEVAEICLGHSRTGDLGRRWSDGTLEFVGGLGTDPAADPTETMGVLRGLPGVHDALVAEFPEPDGSTALVGYIAGPDDTFDVAAAHPQLAIRLPDHLVPRHLVVLDRLPLTETGEYDLGALPMPDEDSTQLDAYVAPRTPLERQLAGILGDLLATERIGVHDSFFELGGFSLLATQLNSRIRESVQVDLTLRDIFESATVEVLAQRIVRAQAEQARAEDVEALLHELESAGA